MKEDIPGLEFIQQLRPISYEVKRNSLQTFLGEKRETETELKASGARTYSRRSIGFVAQEVEKLLNDNGYTPIGIEPPQNEKDHYRIRYSEFVVPLVKAVQELSKENEQQKQLFERQIVDLRKKLQVMKDKVEGTSTTSSRTSQSATASSQSSLEGFSLQQNVPNPFDQSTTIRATVPQNVQRAKIVVYNMQGLELESYPLTGRGNTSVEIVGGQFPAGLYLYALIADGQVIDTKKMALEK